MKIVVYLLKILALSLVLIIFQAILPSPWWLFVVPVFVLGVALPPSFWQRKAFLKGFIAGMLSWSLPMGYYGLSYQGNVTGILSDLIGLPFPVIVLTVGIISGILVGLALVSGIQLRSGKETVKLEI